MERNQVMDDETVKLLFGEYQLIRETAIHFDKILLDIRKNTVVIAFIIFGLIVETFRVKNVLYGLKPIDLAIALTLIEFLMVLTFFYLERHYRIYLLKIAKLAVEYEKVLGLSKDGVGMDGVSRCLNRVHDEKMDLWSRIAHFNIFTFLMVMGLLAFSMLMELRIGLSFKDILSYSVIVFIILFSVFVIYGLRNIKKQKDKEDTPKLSDSSEEVIPSLFAPMGILFSMFRDIVKKYRLHDDFIVYLLSIVIFIISPSISFYILNNDFASSFHWALIISIIFFFLFGFLKDWLWNSLVKKLLIRLNILP